MDAQLAVGGHVRGCRFDRQGPWAPNTADACTRTGTRLVALGGVSTPSALGGAEGAPRGPGPHAGGGLQMALGPRSDARRPRS